VTLQAPQPLLPVQLLDPWRIHIGHGFGLRGGFLSGTIQWCHQTPWDMAKALAYLRTQILVSERMADALAGVALDIQGFLKLFHALDTAQGNPLAQAARLLQTERGGDHAACHRVAVASQHPKATLALLQWMVRTLAQAHLPAGAPPLDPNTPRLLATAQRLTRAVNMGGINNRRIIQAAVQLEMPVKLLPQAMILVGTGKAARTFSCTITEQTPNIGVHIAKIKSLTAQFLRMHGLPTPQHTLFNDTQVEEAAQAANAMGYPVVIKPDDLDGGIGVHARLVDEAQVRTCFALAASHSKQILVEQFIEGDDYRITVVDGAMVKAIGRRPGGITGDGQRSIRNIIEQDAAIIKRKHPGRKFVTLDEEALSMLKQAGRSPGDVLPAGAFQALRRRANMSTGGTSHDVRDIIHPDNVQLALRAAQALKLDIAGIDLITPDIRRSWMDVNAAICEVNAQPQISSEFAEDVYLNLLRQRLPARHRLRTVLLVDFGTESAGATDLPGIETELMQQGESVLCIRDHGIWLDAKKIAPLHTKALSAAMLAEINPHATAIVVCLPIQHMLENGSPWLYIDHLCVLGFTADNAAQRHDLTQLQRLVEGHLQRPMGMYAERFVQTKDRLLDTYPEHVESLRAGWPRPIATQEASVSP